ncbi:hypothetical protein AT3G63215 [Arabidopsis thaliana]|uniref:Uncharacterized protein n=2 Tax=Arabidopsis thaliana TaxID=3702 RepID=A0A1I9LLX9_ARATH|nr:uncharacterized protein AT3G63215 [Arabidopsis thaliana]ANM63587.1 hypothetical protein AT3G63215 [Arabidopsis thaliana]CAA0388239.1 unnamed protein product [Arabidopsis thaliana]|eukprot:NP_001325665.1 hypothetical protein AT3G63215 [Arabidopsis thaliana]
MKRDGEGVLARSPFDQEASPGTCTRCCKNLSLPCTTTIVKQRLRKLSVLLVSMAGWGKGTEQGVASTKTELSKI